MLCTVLLALSASLAAQAPSQQPPQAFSTSPQSQGAKRANYYSPNYEHATNSKKKTGQYVLLRLDKQEPSDHQDTPTKEQESQNQQEERLSRYTLYLAVFTALMALATTGLAVVGFCQWLSLRQYVKVTRTTAEAAKKSAEIAEASLHDLERPWIFVFPTDLTGLSAPAATDLFMLDLTYQMQNQGRTPAWILGKSVGMKLIPPPIPNDLPRVTGISDNTPLAAGGGFKQLLVDKLSSAEMQQLTSEVANLLFFGRIDYKDIFGSSHFTEFCFKFEARYTRDVLDSGGGAWSNVETHTKYT